jgi:translin
LKEGDELMASTVGSVVSLDRIAERARSYLEDKNAARERALARSREVIRSSANAIRAVHRHEFERARALLAEARQALDSATASVAGYGDLLYAGFIHDAAKEYAEAAAVVAVLSGEPLPDPDAVGAAWPAYLNGLGEAVGEFRRFLLNDLRRGELAAPEALLEIMDDIYDILVTMDYPDAITGGLRRTTDVVRGILEKTRGDLTVALRQAELEQQLLALETQLRPSAGPPSTPTSP